MFEAYLDIETTGLSCLYADITVIGIYLVNDVDSKLVQLVGKETTRDNLLEPFIRTSLGVDLSDQYQHHDLMYDCWRNNLYGGFKAVEQQLGIPRQLQGINGWDAVLLWQRYQYSGDQKALATLLKYNEEDVVNLKVLRERLSV